MSATSSESATAYHEAGHAAIAIYLGRAVQQVSVRPNQTRLGQCQLKKGRRRASHDPIETEILIRLAGLAAEARHTGQYGWAGAAQDLREVRLLTQARANGERQIARLERRMLDKAEHILERPGVWRAIEQIALQLLQATTISGRAAHHFYEQAVGQADFI
ncbi:MAG: cell division protein FtsH [Pirellulales bacterium]